MAPLTALLLVALAPTAHASTTSGASQVDRTRPEKPEDRDPGRVSFRIRPLALLADVYGAELEFLLSSRFSLSPSVYRMNESGQLANSTLNVMEYALRFLTLWGDLARGRDGWYTSASLLHFVATIEAPGAVRTFGMWGARILTGYQWTVDALTPRLTVRLGAGFAYKEPEVNNAQIANRYFPAVSNQRFDPSLDLSLGYAL